jgi:hypothetical protein
LNGEDILELDHAGIGEQQCRIVARHQRARLPGLVALRRNNREGGADIVGGLQTDSALGAAYKRWGCGVIAIRATLSKQAARLIA